MNEAKKTVTMVFPHRVLLLLDNHRRVEFKAGVQEVPEELSDHFYLKDNGVKRYEPHTPPVEDQTTLSNVPEPPEKSDEEPPEQSEGEESPERDSEDAHSGDSGAATATNESLGESQDGREADRRSKGIPDRNPAKQLKQLKKK